jgi:predicted O-methyltransferase YrrM
MTPIQLPAIRLSTTSRAASASRIGKEAIVTTLASERVAQLLTKLHQDAEASDREHVEAMMAAIGAPGASMDELIAGLLAEERSDYRAIYQRYAGNYLAVTPTYGRFLYAMARACKATRIVEFGTSMGISTIYLAAALRDNGGGRLIGSEFQPGKVARARANLDAAGLGDLVEIREGDARETLKDAGGEVDLLLVDGAFSLYLPVLKLVEPYLRPGAVVLGENAFDPDYLNYVRDPANGYLAQMLPLDEGRGNAFAVRVG